MNEIPIYKSEASDENVAKSIRQSGSIAYLIPVDVADDNTVVRIKSIADISLASKNDSDLYFLKSILVTTSWNKNDDVFSPYETWAARHTPTHKPTNLEHDETKLVGHIVDCWPMNDDGSIVPDNCTIEDLPSKFHLVTGAVLYKNWEKEELQKRTATLIEEIEHGTKFVSMEVLFSDFDYAIQSPDGKSYTKARNEETSWMTKHLRSYGGDGICEGYKIGRLLKNLTFCGKGYVDKPANPESVIFSTKDNSFNFSTASNNLTILQSNGVVSLGISDSQTGEINMSNENKDQERIDKLTEEVTSLKVEKEQLNAKLAKTIEDNKVVVDGLAEKVTLAETKYADLSKVLEDEKASKAELQTQLATIKASEVKANRISTLVDGGIDKEKATQKVDLFANLTDEQFTVVATELVNAAKAQVVPETKEEEVTEETDPVETKTEEVLENAEANQETQLNIDGGQEPEIEGLRKELRSALAARLGRKVKDNESNKEV